MFRPVSGMGQGQGHGHAHGGGAAAGGWAANNVKTVLCKNWSEGSCSYGDSCSFAHGEEQIKGSKLEKVSSVLDVMSE